MLPALMGSAHALNWNVLIVYFHCRVISAPVSTTFTVCFQIPLREERREMKLWACITCRGFVALMYVCLCTCAFENRHFTQTSVQSKWLTTWENKHSFRGRGCLYQVGLCIYCISLLSNFFYFFFNLKSASSCSKLLWNLWNLLTWCCGIASY